MTLEEKLMETNVVEIIDEQIKIIKKDANLLPQNKVYKIEALEELRTIVSRIELPVKPEICVNTDKLNGSGEYYYNAKLSELFTLNNLIPQLETKVDFVEGEELAQYEVSQIYYIAKERIAVNIYLDEY